MKARWMVWSAFVSVAAAVLAACGGADATPTSVPLAATPTAAPRPTATTAPTAPPVAITATATVAAATATARPLPSATPTASAAAVPTPVSLTGKRGGTLNLRAISTPVAWDTFDARGSSDFHTLGGVMNNLIWPDPYRDGYTLVGDLAESWELSAQGQVITFRLRQGARWHDGTPFTSADVLYNFDRALKPRSPTMTFFLTSFAPIDKVEAPDGSTVRVTLKQPSNAFLRQVATNPFLIYPSSAPFPEKLDQWKQTPVGTGPFKFKSITPATKIEVSRNDAYWKPGLPYLDGIVYTVISAADPAAAAIRAGRIDAANLDTSVVDRLTPAVRQEIGFTAYPLVVSRAQLTFNKKAPLTDQRVRQAIGLAVDRQTILKTWLEDRGTALAPPLIPPELGGQWGISTDVMKNRPGFRTDKTADVAAAKQLLAQAGIDPAKTTIKITGLTSQVQFPTVVERNLADLGFATKLEVRDPGSGNDILFRGEFDIEADLGNPAFDDPADYLNPWIVTGGSKNYGKWSDPALDALLADQDKELDFAKRKDLLTRVQQMVLDQSVISPVVIRQSASGHLPWVKNYPTKLPFLFSSFFRWEQVYLDR